MPIPTAPLSDFDRVNLQRAYEHVEQVALILDRCHRYLENVLHLREPMPMVQLTDVAHKVELARTRLATAAEQLALYLERAQRPA